MSASKFMSTVFGDKNYGSFELQGSPVVLWRCRPVICYGEQCGSVLFHEPEEVVDVVKEQLHRLLVERSVS